MDVEGSKSRQTVQNALSPEQTKVSQSIGNFLTPFIGQSGSEYTGKLVSDMPKAFTDAFQTLTKTAGKYTEPIAKMLSSLTTGTPMYNPDEKQTVDDWEKNYANPVMESWKKTILPTVNQSYAGIPGGFYSSARGRGVTSQANDFYSQYVMPSLFNAQQNTEQLKAASLENAGNRMLPAISALQALPGAEFNTIASASGLYREQEQLGLSAQYNEWLRTRPENSPWLQLGLSYMGIPTTTVTTKSDSWGNGLGAQWLSPTGLAGAVGAGI
jgi:hypothetical protein